MASQLTALTEFSTVGDSRTYTTAGHSIGSPKLVIQKRKVPLGGQSVAETSVQVLHGAVDAEGLPTKAKVSAVITVRQPIDAVGTVPDDVLAIIRDIVAGDEFANSVATQEWLA